MDEADNQMVVPENTAPQAESEGSESQQTQIEDRQERNWRELRRINAELEKKARAQDELLQNFVRHQMQANASPAVADELDSIPDADYIPKGDVKKLLNKERESFKREAAEETRRILAERDQANFHHRLKQKFDDFDDIVTPETLEIFENQDPELAATIAESKDPYKMGLQTYRYIKSMGLSSKAPAHRRSKEVEQRIEQNSKTVPSPQAYDKRPMAATFRMTESMKNDLWKEMNQYASQASSVPPM